MRIRCCVIALVAALLVCAGGGAPARADDAAASALYLRAIAAMTDLPQPRYLSYDMESKGDGLMVDPVVQRGAVWLDIHGGSGTERWPIAHRTYDYETVFTADSKQYLTARSFFDPTWYGAYRALHQGMFDTQDAAPPRDLDPHPGPSPDLGLSTIAMSSVMGPRIYRVYDRGATTCANGDAGRALHLVSRLKGGRHQLTDVIVDTTSDRFCMMRFDEHGGIGFHGYLDQYYGNVDGYWLQTGGFMDGTLRAFGISLHHGTWSYRLTNVRFPAQLPPGTFAPSTGSG